MLDARLCKPSCGDDSTASDPRGSGASQQASTGLENRCAFLSDGRASALGPSVDSLGPIAEAAQLAIAGIGAGPRDTEHAGNLDALRVGSAVNASDSAAVLAPLRSKDGRPCTLPLRPTAKGAEARTEAITRPMEARQ